MCAECNYEQAARLLGSARAVRDAAGTPLQPHDHADVERDAASARSGLDQAIVEAACEDGKAMTLEDAVSYAVGVVSKISDSR